MFVIMLFIATPSIAQEKQDMPGEENYRPADESQHLDSGPTHKEVSRDSVIVKPVSTAATRPKTEGANGKKNQEETLSYNVLYYIIQKFKVSDIIN
jgi:hypothetical protein